MARQNFLSGGYIGKLGETVGQRWRNKRTIRTYVPTNSSKTPAQLSARAMFRKANKLAQVAFNFNRGAPEWQTPENNEWSLRVGTAMRRLRAGLSDNEAIPYFPDNLDQSLNITVVDFAPMSHFSNCNFVNETVHIRQSRAMRFTYSVFDIATSQMVTKTIDINLTANAPFNITIPINSTFLWVRSSWIEGATIDDSSFGGQSITMERHLFTNLVTQNITVPVAFNAPSWDLANNRVTVQASIPAQPFLYRNFSMLYRRMVDGVTLTDAQTNILFGTNNSATSTITLSWNWANQYTGNAGIPENSQVFDLTHLGIRYTWETLTLAQPQTPFPPSVTVPTLSVATMTHFDPAIISNSSTTLILARRVRFTARVYDIATSAMIDKTFDIDVPAGTPFTATLPNDGSYIWVNSSYIEGASLNDANFGDFSVTVSRFNMSGAIPMNIPVPVTLSVQQWDSSNHWVLIRASIMDKAFIRTNVIIPVNIANAAGTLSPTNITVRFFTQNNSTLDFSSDWDYSNQYKNGAGISAGSQQSSSTYYNLVFSWSALALSQPSVPFPPSVTVPTLSVATMTHFDPATISNSAITLILARRIRFSARVYDIATSAMITKTFDIDVPAGTPFTATLPNDGSYIWVNTSWVSGASLNDTDFGGYSVTVTQFNMSGAITMDIPLTVSLSVQQWDSANSRVLIRASIMDKAFLRTNITLSIRIANNAGTLTPTNFAANFSTQNVSTLDLPSTWNYYNQYKNGSNIVASNQRNNGTYYNLVFSWSALTLTQPSVPARPDVSIDAVSFAAMTHFDPATISKSTVTLPNARAMSFTYRVYDIALGAMDNKVISATIPANTAFSLTIPNNGSFLWTDTSWIEGASTDNASFDSVTVTLVRQSMPSSITHDIPVTVTLGAFSFTANDNIGQFTASIPNRTVLIEDINIPVYNGGTNLLSNAFIAGAEFKRNSNYQLTVYIPWTRYKAYTSGAMIKAESDTIDKGFFRLVYSWAQLATNNNTTPSNENYLINIDEEESQTTNTGVDFIGLSQTTRSRIHNVWLQFFNPYTDRMQTRYYQITVNQGSDLPLSVPFPDNELVTTDSILYTTSRADSTSGNVRIVTNRFTCDTGMLHYRIVAISSYNIEWTDNSHFRLVFTDNFKSRHPLNDFDNIEVRLWSSSAQLNPALPFQPLVVITNYPTLPFVVKSPIYDITPYPTAIYARIAQGAFAIEEDTWRLAFTVGNSTNKPLNRP